MNIRTCINPFVVAYKVADCIDSSFPVLTPTNVLPISDGVLKITPNTNFGQTADNNIHFVFYGEGSDDSTFQVQIVYWTKVPVLNGQYNPSVDLWIPEIVYNVDCALSTSVGVAGTGIDNNHNFVDTIATTSSTANIANPVIISPTNNNIASLTIPMTGPQLIQVLFKLGSATAANAIYKTF